MGGEWGGSGGSAARGLFERAPPSPIGPRPQWYRRVLFAGSERSEARRRKASNIPPPHPTPLCCASPLGALAPHASIPSRSRVPCSPVSLAPRLAFSPPTPSRSAGERECVPKACGVCVCCARASVPLTRGGGGVDQAGESEPPRAPPRGMGPDLAAMRAPRTRWRRQGSASPAAAGLGLAGCDEDGAVRMGSVGFNDGLGVDGGGYLEAFSLATSVRVESCRTSGSSSPAAATPRGRARPSGWQGLRSAALVGRR
jgi:hypothetical protein